MSANIIVSKHLHFCPSQTPPQRFQTKMGPSVFPNFSVLAAVKLWSSVDTRLICSRVDAFFKQNIVAGMLPQSQLVWVSIEKKGGNGINKCVVLGYLRPMRHSTVPSGLWLDWCDREHPLFSQKEEGGRVGVQLHTSEPIPAPGVEQSWSHSGQNYLDTKGNILQQEYALIQNVTGL